MNQPAKKAPPGPRPPPTEAISRCISKLEAALAIRISHTDTDSRVEQLNSARTRAMQEVLAELRTLA